MGLMDRVKAQANQLGQQAKEAAQAGQQKIDQVQAQRRADAMLRQLGVLMFADRTGRGAADTQTKVDQLVTDLTAYERENGLNLTAEPAQQGYPWQQNAGGQPQQQQSPGGQPQQQDPFAGQQQHDPFAGQQQQQGGFGGATFFPGADNPGAAPGPGDQQG